jgi:hypothetical protein
MFEILFVCEKWKMKTPIDNDLFLLIHLLDLMKYNVIVKNVKKLPYYFLEMN